MKLAFKIAMAVTVVIATLLGLDGFFRVRRQLETFEKDTRRDHLSMGRATAAAINEAWGSYGESVAMDLVERIGRKTSRVSIRWVPEAAFYRGEHVSGLSPEQVARVRAGRSVSVIRRDAAQKRRMVTYFPIEPSRTVEGFLEISESLSMQSRHVRRTVQRTVFITVSTILVCALATLLLGVHLIGRPIRQLVRQAAAIGRGEFENRLAFNRRDELRELFEEMNTMATKLTDAMATIESKTKAHLETLAQLRHADRLKTVGQLTSSVVHEVGTPLTVIAGRAKMIQSAEAEGEEARDCARIVVEQAERVTRTVRQILDFARSSKTERRTQDVRGIVDQMVELLSPVAIKAGIYLDVSLGDEPAYAYVDANQIQQVLANLIINGVQAAASGGHVTISVRQEETTAPDSAEASPKTMWTVVVKDDGCGIEAEAIERIFESFYTTKASGNGTGLGLAISKEIIREHGGFITVESVVDQGSEFRIHLPAERG